MGLHLDMAGTLLLMVLTTSVCTLTSLRTESSEEELGKFTAGDSVEDSEGDSDSESEELREHVGGFFMDLNGGSQPGTYQSTYIEGPKEEGSGM